MWALSFALSLSAKARMGLWGSARKYVAGDGVGGARDLGWVRARPRLIRTLPERFRSAREEQ